MRIMGVIVMLFMGMSMSMALRTTMMIDDDHDRNSSDLTQG